MRIGNAPTQPDRADSKRRNMLEMKKTSSRARRPTAEGGTAPKTSDEYLARLPEPARGTLNKIRAGIRAAVPAEAEEILSYGIPAFRHKKIIVWYAAFSKHCSLFPTAAVIAKFKDELAGYTISKGTIQFPIDKPLPAALLKKIVKTRLAAIEPKR